MINVNTNTNRIDFALRVRKSNMFKGNRCRARARAREKKISRASDFEWLMTETRVPDWSVNARKLLSRYRAQRVDTDRSDATARRHSKILLNRVYRVYRV